MSALSTDEKMDSAVICRLTDGVIRVQWGVLSKYTTEKDLEANQGVIVNDFYKEATTLEGAALAVHRWSLGTFDGRVKLAPADPSRIVSYVLAVHPESSGVKLGKYFTHIGDVWAAYIPEQNILYVNRGR